jgi:hypothetical protein
MSTILREQVARLTAELAARTEERDCLARQMGMAFVQGAAWWEYEKTGFTMWPADKNKAMDAFMAKPCTQVPADYIRARDARAKAEGRAEAFREAAIWFKTHPLLPTEMIDELERMAG